MKEEITVLSYFDVLSKIENQENHLLIGNGFNYGLGINTDYFSIFNRMIENNQGVYKDAMPMVEECDFDLEKIIGRLENDTLKASAELRQLRDWQLLNQKGKGRGTYYIAGDMIYTEAQTPNTEAQTLNTEALFKELGPEIRKKVGSIKQKERDQQKILDVILEICSGRYFSLPELSAILRRDGNWLSRQYVKPLLDAGKLEYRYPDMINHPEQAYKTKTTNVPHN